MSINDKIIEVAEKFEGLVEVKSNTDWDFPKTKGKDPEAEEMKRMLKRAWHQDGYAYCMSWTEGVWVTAYEQIGAKPETVRLVQQLFSPSVMESFSKCKEKGLIFQEPKRGAVFFYQMGNKWQGHAGIVELVKDGWMHTIEANTSPSPTSAQADRDGGIGTGGVWRKRRIISTKPSTKSLWLRGFVNPIAP